MGNEITVYDVSQGTDEWIALHCGIPTASEFGMLITSKGERSRSADDFATILAADKYAGQILDRFGGKELEGLRYDEIAAVLKCNINTVRTRLKRAREALFRYAKKGVVSHEV